MKRRILRDRDMINDDFYSEIDLEDVGRVVFFDRRR